MARRCSGFASATSTTWCTQEGVSPAWPLKYDDPRALLRCRLKSLFHVHGASAARTRPSRPLAAPISRIRPVAHEADDRGAQRPASRRRGMRPFHLPLGILLDEKDGQGDPHQHLHPMQRLRRLPLPAQRQSGRAGDLHRPDDRAARQCHAPDGRLRVPPRHRSRAGRRVDRPSRSSRDGVARRPIRGRPRRRRLRRAESSALLLLRSDERPSHPDRDSPTAPDQVGRNYIRHNQSVLMALLKAQEHAPCSRRRLPSATSTSNRQAWEHPMGLIQMCATSHGAQIRGETVPGWLELACRDVPFDKMADHALDFWLSSEDLPIPGKPHLLRRRQAWCSTCTPPTWRRIIGSRKQLETMMGMRRAPRRC